MLVLDIMTFWIVEGRLKVAFFIHRGFMLLLVIVASIHEASKVMSTPFACPLDTPLGCGPYFVWKLFLVPILFSRFHVGTYCTIITQVLFYVIPT